MAEAKAEERTEAAATTSAPKANTEALSQLVNAANALESVRAQQAIEAMKLPEKRLDDASEGGGAPGYTLRQVGTDDDGNPQYVRIDAFGNELGKATRADLRGG